MTIIITMLYFLGALRDLLILFCFRYCGCHTVTLDTYYSNIMGRLVPVKLRPDQYIDQIRDTTKRRGWKARVIRSKDIIKYIKVKKLFRIGLKIFKIYYYHSKK